MSRFWYSCLNRTAGLLGPWFFAIVARIIAAGFFLFSGRAGESCRFYAILYPHKKPVFHLLCAFRQFQNFTTIHFDRFLERNKQEVSFTSDGWQRLAENIGKKGGILLMSHLGNWEMAATLLKKQKKDVELLLYMGIKEKEVIERVQKEELRASGVTIIGVDQADNSPFSAVAALKCLRNGGLVSIAGDIVWRGDQRNLAVTFLGKTAYIPEAPFVFALLSGAPLYAFFAFREGKNQYQITLSQPITIAAENRQDRRKMVENAAQEYALLLEQALLQHPLEWYHFDRFLH